MRPTYTAQLLLTTHTFNGFRTYCSFKLHVTTLTTTHQKWHAIRSVKTNKNISKSQTAGRWDFFQLFRMIHQGAIHLETTNKSVLVVKKNQSFSVYIVKSENSCSLKRYLKICFLELSSLLISSFSTCSRCQSSIFSSLLGPSHPSSAT